MRHGTITYATVGFAILVSGCDRGPTDNNAATTDPTVTIRDSAGIEIVENHAPEHPTGSFWSIDPEPEILLGGSDDLSGNAGDSAQLVWSVVGLARLPDGRLAVLSSENRQLMLFEPSGELSGIVGGPGEGPGEFTRPERLQFLPPDTLVVWDYFLTAIDYFDSSGKLLRERSVDYARLREHGAWGESRRIPLPDGSLLVGVMDTVADESADDCTHLTVTGRSSILGDMVLHAEELLKIDDDYAAHSFGCASSFSSLMATGGDPPSFYCPQPGQRDPSASHGRHAGADHPSHDRATARHRQGVAGGVGAPANISRTDDALVFPYGARGRGGTRDSPKIEVPRRRGPAG